MADAQEATNQIILAAYPVGSPKAKAPPQSDGQNRTCRLRIDVGLIYALHLGLGFRVQGAFADQGWCLEFMAFKSLGGRLSGSVFESELQNPELKACNNPL